jgi:putative SOS response-associated peptidase YedK
VCGRFTRFTPAADIAKAFSAVASQVEIKPSYNVAPTGSIYVVKGGVSRAINELHWGLVPAWSKDISRASSMINARVESVREKTIISKLAIDQSVRRTC